jgi:hypothetical protein
MCYREFVRVVILGRGVLMWLRTRYMLFRPLMNMYLPREYFSVYYNNK